MWIHGGDIVSVEAEYPDTSFLDFSANINPLGQPESVRHAIDTSSKASMDYPDPFYRKLREGIGEFEGVKKGHVLCGNGAAEIIFKIAYYFTPKTALILAPTFGEYQLALEQVGTVVKHHILKKENDFQLTKSILKEIPFVDMVFLCSPNNPTGQVIPLPLLKEILECCNKHWTTLVIDECFMDFIEGQPDSMTSLIAEEKNLIILKAFTKSFAIPGIRLGYALVSDLNVREGLEKTGPPWNISTPAQRGGIAAVTEKIFLQKSQRYVAKAREIFSQELSDLGLKVFPSSVNYILFYTPEEKLREKLLPLGLIIRDCSNYIGLGKGYYRVAVKKIEENKKLIKGLGLVLCQKS